MNLKPGLDLSARNAVGKPMRSYESSGERNFPVSIFVEMADPYPAPAPFWHGRVVGSILIGATPKPAFDFFGDLDGAKGWDYVHGSFNHGNSLVEVRGSGLLMRFRASLFIAQNVFAGK